MSSCARSCVRSTHTLELRVDIFVQASTTQASVRPWRDPVKFLRCQSGEALARVSAIEAHQGFREPQDELRECRRDAWLRRTNEAFQEISLSLQGPIQAGCVLDVA